MADQALKTKIENVLKSSRLGSLATINNGKPWVRYMDLQSDENMNLYSSTFANSRKIDQLKKDNNVHVTIGGDPKNYKAPYLNITGKAAILTDTETKKRFWMDMLSQFFSGPEDPNYVVLKIVPEQIEYMSEEDMQPKIYKP